MDRHITQSAIIFSETCTKTKP